MNLFLLIFITASLSSFIFSNGTTSWCGPCLNLCRKRTIIVYTKATTGDVLLKKSAARNFAMLTERHLCWSLFLIKFFCLSEADQSLLKKEATKFLQSEEISFELFDNLNLNFSTSRSAAGLNIN